MIIQPRHFVRFIDGRAGDRVTIAFLPGALGAHINTLQTEIFLRRDYALKLLRKGLSYDSFDEIQNTIDNGHCLYEKTNKIYFLYVRDNVRLEIYFLLLKTDKTRREIWLVTFHRIQKAQFTNRLDRRRILRDHIELEFTG